MPSTDNKFGKTKRNPTSIYRRTTSNQTTSYTRPSMQSSQYAMVSIYYTTQFTRLDQTSRPCDPYHGPSTSKNLLTLNNPNTNISTSCSKITLFHLNIRSLKKRDHFIQIRNLARDKNYEVISLSETWLNSSVKMRKSTSKDINYFDKTDWECVEVVLVFISGIH